MPFSQEENLPQVEFIAFDKFHIRLSSSSWCRRGRYSSSSRFSRGVRPPQVRCAIWYVTVHCLVVHVCCLFVVWLLFEYEWFWIVC